jgi:hypothetical protein
MAEGKLFATQFIFSPHRFFKIFLFINWGETKLYCQRWTEIYRKWVAKKLTKNDAKKWSKSIDYKLSKWGVKNDQKT